LLERAVDVFGAGSAPEPVNLAPLHAKIGQLALDFTAATEGRCLKRGCWVRPELPTASAVTSQAPSAAVDNSAPVPMTRRLFIFLG
jgi:hypothetical protein